MNKRKNTMIRAPKARLYPWQRRILRLLVESPGSLAGDIGERYAPSLPRHLRAYAAIYELKLLEQENLVQRSRGRWSPSLMAAEMLERAA